MVIVANNTEHNQGSFIKGLLGLRSIFRVVPHHNGVNFTYLV